MMWMLILKLYDFGVAFLNQFVHVTYQWDRWDDNQWVLVNYYSMPTEKGWQVIWALSTIVHQGLDFVAQLTTLLPAWSGANYPASNIGGAIIPLQQIGPYTSP